MEFPHHHPWPFSRSPIDPFLEHRSTPHPPGAPPDGGRRRLPRHRPQFLDRLEERRTVPERHSENLSLHSRRRESGLGGPRGQDLFSPETSGEARRKRRQTRQPLFFRAGQRRSDVERTESARRGPAFHPMGRTISREPDGDSGPRLQGFRRRPRGRAREEDIRPETGRPTIRRSRQIIPSNSRSLEIETIPDEVRPDGVNRTAFNPARRAPQ